MKNTRLRVQIDAMLLIFVGLVIHRPAAASDAPRAAHNPATFAAPKGQYQLLVDPTDRSGSGAANYRLTQNQVEVWSALLPYTLHDCIVTDAGYVAGYAHYRGPPAPAIPSPTDTDPESEDDLDTYRDYVSQLHVVILDPQGREKAHETYDRRSSHQLHAASVPNARGLFFLAEGSRFVLRVGDDDESRTGESWWSYDVGSGKPIGKCEPAKHHEIQDVCNNGWISDVVPVTTTPLALVRWIQSSENGQPYWFSLVNTDGKPVWKWRPEAGPVDPEAEQQAEERGDYRYCEDTIHPTTEARRFQVLLKPEMKLVQFGVESTTPGSWKVSELARTDFVAQAAADPWDGIPDQPFDPIGVITLKTSDEAPSAIRDIQQFTMDGEGRIYFIRREPKGPDNAVCVGQNGDLFGEISLADIPIVELSSWSEMAWLKDRQVLVTRNAGRAAEAGAWVLDFATQEVRKLENFSSHQLDCIAGLGEDGFVGIGSWIERSTGYDGMTIFDRDGKKIWSNARAGYDRAPSSMLSPEDVTVSREGVIAVLDNIRHTIQCFAKDGEFVEIIDLETTWGKDPNYPTEIAATSQGWVIWDFRNPTPLVHVDFKGKILSEQTIQLANGNPVIHVSDLSVAPDGRVWVSSRDYVLRVGDDGQVDRVLGRSTSSTSLENIANLVIDREDRFHAVDRHSAAIHVFDRSGRHIRTTKVSIPEGDLRPDHLTVSDEGQALLLLKDYSFMDESNQSVYFNFAADGTLVEQMPLKERWSEPAYYFQPGTRNRWSVHRGALWLLDESGQTLRKIERRPNNDWLEQVNSLSVAPDGSVALLVESMDWSDERRAICIYSATGDPERMFEMPKDRDRGGAIAYDGEHLILARGSKVFVYDSDGTPQRQWDHPVEGKPQTHRQPFIRSGGRELVLFEGGSQSIEVFKLSD